MKPTWITGCLLGAALAVPGAARAQGCGPGCNAGGPGAGGPGCVSPWHIDNCATIPRRAQPAPIGTYVNGWNHLQESKAELDDFVFYQNMWYRGGTELGPMGAYYLDMVANRMGKVPFPIVVATSHDDRLDAARREVIITHLRRRGLTDPTRVIVAFPIAEGLLGEEAPRIASSYLVGGGYGNGIGGFLGGFGGGGIGGFR